MADEDKAKWLTPYDFKRLLQTVLAPNKDAFVTDQLNITVAGTAEQLPDVAVPDGCRLTVIAKPGNTGVIYFGRTKSLAEGASKFDGLSAGLAHSFNITNANLIWINAAVSGEGVSYYVEQ